MNNNIYSTVITEIKRYSYIIFPVFILILTLILQPNSGINNLTASVFAILSAILFIGFRKKISGKQILLRLEKSGHLKIWENNCATLCILVLIAEIAQRLSVEQFIVNSIINASLANFVICMHYSITLAYCLKKRSKEYGKK